MPNFPGASHLPILAKIMDNSIGPVLEMGMGYYSTPFLYWKCKEQNRKLISLENDAKWMDKLEMTDRDELNFYAHHIEDWNDPRIENNHWGVVLIDHRPAKRRRIDAKRLSQKADFVIMHDSEPEIDRFYRYGYAYKHFKYRYDYEKVGNPRTTILSNFVDLSKLFS